MSPPIEDALLEHDLGVSHSATTAATTMFPCALGNRKQAGETCKADQESTNLLTTLTILPLLIPQNGGAALLSSDTLGFGQRLTECACTNLAVLVEATGEYGTVNIPRLGTIRTTYVKVPRQVVLIVENVYGR